MVYDGSLDAGAAGAGALDLGGDATATVDTPSAARPAEDVDDVLPEGQAKPESESTNVAAVYGGVCGGGAAAAAGASQPANTATAASQSVVEAAAAVKGAAAAAADCTAAAAGTTSPEDAVAATAASDAAAKPSASLMEAKGDAEAPRSLASAPAAIADVKMEVAAGEGGAHDKQ